MRYRQEWWRAFGVLAGMLSLALPVATAKNNSDNVEDEDMSGRGSLMFGDKCTSTQECSFPGSVCDPGKNTCQCRGDLEATNHLNLCGKPAQVNESCTFNEQCEAFLAQTECRFGRCACRFDMVPGYKDNVLVCTNTPQKPDEGHKVDPTMIVILVVMAVMFIIICVVLRLFSKARWRENRSIFNTPNPRLMNASLLQHKSAEQRRGSKGSVRGPSRAPSVTSLRPHSPAASMGSKNSRSNSHGSNHSGRDNAKSPVLESVQVEKTPRV